MKRVLIVVAVVIFVITGVFTSLYVYEWWVGAYMSKALSNQLQELGENASGVIELQNIWSAEKLVACRGYLETSERLKKNLLEAGLTTTAAAEIAESQRRTEGTHFYLVKKKRVLYFYDIKHLLYMEHLSTDFICASVGKNIYLDVISDHGFKLEDIR